jgi:hypothetical protein
MAHIKTSLFVGRTSLKHTSAQRWRSFKRQMLRFKRDAKAAGTYVPRKFTRGRKRTKVEPREEAK